MKRRAALRPFGTLGITGGVLLRLEIAVRLAIGAMPDDVSRMVIRDGMAPICVGDRRDRRRGSRSSDPAIATGRRRAVRYVRNPRDHRRTCHHMCRGKRPPSATGHGYPAGGGAGS